jgi:hypothetical protein
MLVGTYMSYAHLVWEFAATLPMKHFEIAVPVKQGSVHCWEIFQVAHWFVICVWLSKYHMLLQKDCYFTLHHCSWGLDMLLVRAVLNMKLLYTKTLSWFLSNSTLRFSPRWYIKMCCSLVLSLQFIVLFKSSYSNAAPLCSWYSVDLRIT